MGVWQRTGRVVSMVTIGALMASGLVAVSVASRVGLAPAAANPPASVIPTAVVLEADKTVFEVGEKVTLTATPDEDITASTYRVVIKDLTTNVVLGHCAKTSSGATWSAANNTCTVTTSFTTGGARTYQAYVAADNALNDTQATSNEVVLERAAWSVSLVADKTVFESGEKVTLTAVPNQNIKGSSYMVVLVDDTTGTMLGYCGSSNINSGATWSAADNACSLTTSFATGGPRTYRAYVAADHLLGNVQATSNDMVLRRAPWTVSLTSSLSVVSAGQRVTLTATPNQNVKSSAYMVAFVNVTTGSVMGYCGPQVNSGSTWSAADNSCTITTTVPSGAVHVYRAYVAYNTLLADIQAISNGFSAPNDGGPMLPSETAGGSNPSQSCSQRCHGDPINTATGEFFENFTDLEVPGLGPALVWSRTYGSQMVGTDAGLGHGWAFAYGMRLVPISGSDLTTAPWVDVVQENGSRVRYAADGVGGFAAPMRVMASLERAEDGSYRFVRGARQVFLFDATGQLVRVEDLNGNGVSLSYNAGGQLTQVTDDASRSLTVTWSGSRIAQVSDPAGRTVSYTYSAAGDLVKATQADGTHLGYGYTNHRVTSMTAADGGTTTNVYDSQGRVISQTDPLGQVMTFAYGAARTTITDASGAVTAEEYVDGQIRSQTKGYGTPAAAMTMFVYGPTNQVESTIDPLGRTTTATYDGAGNRLSQTDPAGRTTTWTYDGLGNVTSTTDPTGATWTFTFDERGNATGSTTPTGATNQATVNPDGTLAAATDPLGRVTSFGYDARGYLASVTDPTGAVSTRTHDVLGRVLSSTDATGVVTTYAYDAGGRVTSTTDPTGATTTLTYDAAGRPATVTDPLGRVTTTVYDAFGQVASVIDPAGGFTSYTYDGAGQVTSVTDPTDATTAYVYDVAGRLVSTTDPLGRESTIVYNKAGEVTSSTSPSGATTSYVYDLGGRLTKTTDPDGAVTTTVYDAAGRPTTVTDPLNRQVSTTYDAAGRVTSVTRADGSTVTWVLDAAGQTTTRTDPSGTTTYAYDAVGRVLSIADPAGRVTTYGYDPVGNLTAQTAPDGSVTTHGYDAAGRRTSTAYPDATPDVTWAYNAAGQVTTVSDGTSYTWTSTGLVSSVTSPTGTVSYTHDAAGRVTTLTYPGTQTVGYAFDAAGQLVEATDWTGGQYTWAWTDDAQVASVTYPNQVTTTVDHDSIGQATAITTSTHTGTDLLALAYAYDAAGQMTTQTAVRSATGRSPPAVATTTTSGYTFDPLGRLDQVTSTGAGAFGWDTAGRLTATADGRTLAYDTAGQVTGVIDPAANTSTAFDYGARGNRTTRHVTSMAGTATSTMTWDAADRLTTLTTPTATTAYTYDATGLRTSAAVTTGAGTTTEHYTWDTTAPVPTLLTDGENGYVYGLGDTPLAQIGLTDDTTVYLHGDLIGSTRTVTDEAGDVVCDTDYDPYGRSTSSTGCTPTTRFGYAGQYQDSTGLTYLRARYYDPTTAQFLSVDPLVHTTHDPYNYTGGNPLQQTDPLGLDWLGWTDSFGPGFWNGMRTVSDAVAGFGDTITFGATRTIRRGLDVDSVVNHCSTAYRWGGYTGTAAGLALPVGGAARVAATAGGRATTMISTVGRPVTASPEAVLRALPAGNSSGVRVVNSSTELNQVYTFLARGGSPVEMSSYRGVMTVRPDGVRVGMRSNSTSGGPTIDIFDLSGPIGKVHVG